MSDLQDGVTTVFCRIVTRRTGQWRRRLFITGGSRTGKRLVFFFMPLLLIWPMLCPQIAAAGNLSLLINGKSWHLSPPRDIEYNENNWGAGVQYDFESYREDWVPFLMASGFIDSFDNVSYYAGAGIARRLHFSEGKEGRHFDAGVVGFMMTRKDFKDGNPFFGMLPAFSFGTRRYAVNMTYVPKVDPKMVALWFFQLKISTENF